MNPFLLTSIAIIIQSIFIRSISSSCSPLANLLSIQLRSLAYLFLRWCPSSLLAAAIPPIFLLYTLAWSRVTPDTHPTKKKELHYQDQTNQNIKSIQETTSSSSSPQSQFSIAQHLPLPPSQSSSLSSVSETTTIQKNKNHKIKHDHDPHDIYYETDPLLPTINQSEQIKKTVSTQAQHKIIHQSDAPSLFRSIVNLTIGFTNRRNSNSKISRITFLINLILTFFCLDYTFRTVIFYGEEDLSFSRVGAVGETWAKVHVRIPPKNTNLNENLNGLEHQTTTGAQLVYRPMKPIGNWLLGPDLITSNASDWTTVGKIINLSPGQTYEYRLNSLQDFNQPHELFEAVGHFKTAPDTTLLSDPKADGGSFTFAYSSCMKPGFPYNPLRHPLHNDGAEQLSEFVKKLKLDFVLFLGDFIYADAPIYMGNSINHYQRKYRQSFAADGWKKIMQFTRTIHIYDDHEILNDWAGNGNDTNEIFEPANKAYIDYLGSGNYEGPGSGKNYYWFRYGDAGFFVWDCRRYRSPNEQLDDHSKTMLGIEQKNTFISWLSAVNSTVTFKFVVSSTPFMSLWSGPDGGIDTWAGYLTERNELMEYMEFVPNLIILSGDRHEFAAASIRETVVEFSTSPLNQFWFPLRTLSQENGLGKTGEDKLMKYIPNGIHKFSTLNVDCRDPKKPTVYFQLYIDEKLSWEIKYLGKPVKEEPKQLGQIIPSWEQLLNFLKPIKWFSDTVTNTMIPDNADTNTNTNTNNEDREDSESFLDYDLSSDDTLQQNIQSDHVL